MPEDVWPEFLYGGLTLDRYIELVTTTRDTKREVLALVDLIQDITKYPYPASEEQFQYITMICRAIRGLVSQ